MPNTRYPSRIHREGGMPEAAAVVNSRGNRQAIASTDFRGLVLDSSGREAKRADIGHLGIWLPFRDAAGTTGPLVDRAGGVSFLQKPTAAVTVGAASPYYAFNGTNYWQADFAGPKALVKQLFNTKTLFRDGTDMLIWWVVFNQLLNQAGTKCLWFYGRSGDQGFGFEVQSPNNKVILTMRNPGASAADQFGLESALLLNGSANTNTRTAYCLTMSKAPVDLGVSGKGAGIWYMEHCFVPLGVPNSYNQAGGGYTFATDYYPAFANTGGTDYIANSADSLLTVGNRPAGSYTSSFDTLPAGNSMDQIGWQRRPFRSGMAMEVAHELAADPTAHPACLLP